MVIHLLPEVANSSWSLGSEKTLLRSEASEEHHMGLAQICPTVPHLWGMSRPPPTHVTPDEGLRWSHQVSLF